MSLIAPARPFRTSASLVVLALFFAACGGGADAGAGTFAREYREVTEDYQQESAGIQERAQLVSGQGVDRILGVYEEILAAARAARDAFATLEAPDDFKPTFEEIREVMDGQVDALSEMVAAAESRDLNQVTTAATRLTDLNSDLASLQREMDELFAACGEPCD